MGRCLGRGSVRYQEQYKLMHQIGKVYHGTCLQNHAESIKKLIDETESQSLLDYGSGKGIQYHTQNIHVNFFNGIMPTLYDIGIEEYSKLPEGNFDGVYSTDVMEHIPEEELDEVFKQIYSRANKFVYLAISTIPAPDLLPDGTQSHVTIKPIEWWVDKIKPFANVYTQIVCYGNETQTQIIREKNAVN